MHHFGSISNKIEDQSAVVFVRVGGGKISIGFAYRNRPLNSIFTTAKLRF